MLCLLVSSLPGRIQQHCTAWGRRKHSALPRKKQTLGTMRAVTAYCSSLTRSWKSDFELGGGCMLWKWCGFLWDALQQLTRFFKVPETCFSKLSPGKGSLEEVSCNHKWVTKQAMWGLVLTAAWVVSAVESSPLVYRPQGLRETLWNSCAEASFGAQ